MLHTGIYKIYIMLISLYSYAELKNLVYIENTNNPCEDIRTRVKWEPRRKPKEGGKRTKEGGGRRNKREGRRSFAMR